MWKLSRKDIFASLTVPDLARTQVDARLMKEEVMKCLEMSRHALKLLNVQVDEFENLRVYEVMRSMLISLRF